MNLSNKIPFGVFGKEPCNGLTPNTNSPSKRIPHYTHPLGLSFTYNAAGLPTTLLLDSDGQVLALETGAFTSAKELQSFLDDNPGS